MNPKLLLAHLQGEGMVHLQELVRGKKTRRDFLNEILDVLSLTGGELADE